MGAIDDGAEVAEVDLAMLCAAEVKAQIEMKAEDYMHYHYRRNLYARTLFEYSRGELGRVGEGGGDWGSAKS